MIDITHKSYTYREATATAIVAVSRQETINAIQENKVPKGNVFEMAKTAGLLAVKQTANLLPDCHPLPIEHAKVSFDIKGMEIHIEMLVATIYKTGVEVEAMHGASVVALTMYDMLKPIDKGIEIAHIKLIQKKGGKSDYRDSFKKPITSAVVVCSDTISAGQKEDKAGKGIIEKLASYGVNNEHYIILPDEVKDIENNLIKLSDDLIDLIIFTGGTGLSARDVSPESILPLLDRRIPGIEETIRRYGQDRMPYAMLSRSVAGIRKNSLVLALPGSTKGAIESMDALFPHLLHIFKIMAGSRHG
jgi:molybdenum cofactor biosynthesis protein MoaC